MWGNEPSHSQVNSQHGSWNPKWTLEYSKRNYKGQNPSSQRVLYTIGNLLKWRCLKWACITHLDIWNIRYGQKKGRESNWQFDSWPLKVRNLLNFVAFKWCATYHWKAFDEGYNFSLDLIMIGGLHAKLCALKVMGVPVSRISGQKAIWMWCPWRGAKYTVRGKVVAFPNSRPCWVLHV
jgi:hypothetical protein